MVLIGVDHTALMTLEVKRNELKLPQVQLQRHLTEENTAGLPDHNVPFMDALDIYTATLQQLMQ